MDIRYDEEVDALYIQLKKGKYYESDEIKDGFIVDYDKNGRIIGIEILDVSSYMLSKEIMKVSFEVDKAVNVQKKKAFAV